MAPSRHASNAGQVEGQSQGVANPKDSDSADAATKKESSQQHDEDDDDDDDENSDVDTKEELSDGNDEHLDVTTRDEPEQPDDSDTDTDALARERPLKRKRLTISEWGVPNPNTRKPKLSAPTNRFVLTPTSQRPRSVAEKAKLKVASSSRLYSKTSGQPHSRKGKNYRHYQQKTQQYRSANKARSPKQVPGDETADSFSNISGKTTNFLSLPLELQQDVLLRLPSRDVCRVRQASKDCKKLVQKSSDFLVKQFESREFKRLQILIDEVTSLEPPSDLHSMLKTIHIWTKRRGTFDTYGIQCRSLFRLMAHLFMGKVARDEVLRMFYLWRARASAIIDALNESQVWSDSNIRDWFRDPDDSAGSQAFYAFLKRPELHDAAQRICGPTHSGLEHWSWPVGGTLTDLFPYPALPEEEDEEDLLEGLDDFAVWVQDPSLSELEPLAPDFDHARLTKLLWLPDLPNTFFCYYLTEGWARITVQNLLDRFDHPDRRLPVRVSPLMRTAILECVRFF